MWFHFLPPRNGGVGNRVHRGSKPTPPNKNFNYLTKESIMAKGWHGDAAGHRLAAMKRKKKNFTLKNVKSLGGFKLGGSGISDYDKASLGRMFKSEEWKMTLYRRGKKVIGYEGARTKNRGTMWKDPPYMKSKKVKTKPPKKIWSIGLKRYL